MNEFFYPAVFHPEKVGYSVVVPDLDGCFTEGDTLEDAYRMTFEAVGLYLTDLLENGKEFPTASEPNSLSHSADDGIVLIQFNMLDYKKKHNSKAVKKTLTIPSWLNEAAEEKHINFSSVLQQALIERLDIAK